MFILIRILLIIALLMMLFVFYIPIHMGILNAGNAAGILVCVALIAVLLFWKRFKGLIASLWEKRAGKVFVCTVSAIIGFSAILAVVLTAAMSKQVNDPPPDENTTMVVLGCKVKDGKPSLMLQRRLEAAYEYLSEHESVCVVVSGGKGDDELISEAECMKEYLISQGIAAERIFPEDKSTTTKENLLFSKNIIKKNGLPTTITLITDGFHQYRAEMLAKKIDIDPYNISGYTTWYLVPTYYVREWFGIVYYKLFG